MLLVADSSRKCFSIGDLLISCANFLKQISNCFRFIACGDACYDSYSIDWTGMTISQNAMNHLPYLNYYSNLFKLIIKRN